MVVPQNQRRLFIFFMLCSNLRHTGIWKRLPRTPGDGAAGASAVFGLGESPAGPCPTTAAGIGSRPITPPAFPATPQARRGGNPNGEVVNANPLRPGSSFSSSRRARDGGSFLPALGGAIVGSTGHRDQHVSGPDPAGAVADHGDHHEQCPQSMAECLTRIGGGLKPTSPTRGELLKSSREILNSCGARRGAPPPRRVHAEELRQVHASETTSTTASRSHSHGGEASRPVPQSRSPELSSSTCDENFGGRPSFSGESSGTPPSSGAAISMRGQRQFPFGQGVRANMNRFVRRIGNATLFPGEHEQPLFSSVPHPRGRFHSSSSSSSVPARRNQVVPVESTIPPRNQVTVVPSGTSSRGPPRPGEVQVGPTPVDGASTTASNTGTSSIPAPEEYDPTRTLVPSTSYPARSALSSLDHADHTGSREDEPLSPVRSRKKKQRDLILQQETLPLRHGDASQTIRSLLLDSPANAEGQDQRDDEERATAKTAQSPPHTRGHWRQETNEKLITLEDAQHIAKHEHVQALRNRTKAGPLESGDSTVQVVSGGEGAVGGRYKIDDRRLGELAEV